MASDGIPVNVPVTHLVHGSQAPKWTTVHESSGKSLPANGHATAAAAAAPAVHPLLFRSLGVPGVLVDSHA
jgi:hypothetical protein